jgi:hypothetical protein
MGRRLLLVIMIDALGHRLVRESGSFGFLEAPDGPVRSVCGYSSACIPSLLTGRTPAEHGHWAMYVRDPARSPFRRYRLLIRLLAGALGRDYLTRRILARALWHAGVRGYYNLYQIPLRLLPQFDLPERHDLYRPGGVAGYETPFDSAERLGLPWESWAWRLPEQERRARLAAALEAGRAAMLFYYAPEFDAVGHAAGTRDGAAHACLGELSGFVAEMLARAERRYDEVRLLVFGDHGMTDVRGVHDLLGPLASLGLRQPQELLYFVDSTMIRFWSFRAGVRERCAALLAEAGCGRILDDGECEELGILFPDRRYGETIFLADPGEILVPSFMGHDAPRGMHGYHPADEDSSTILLSNFAHTPVRSIMEIGPLMIRELEAIAAHG